MEWQRKCGWWSVSGGMRRGEAPFENIVCATASIDYEALLISLFVPEELPSS